MVKTFCCAVLAVLAVSLCSAAKPNVWFTQADIDTLYGSCQVNPTAQSCLAGLQSSADSWVNRTNSFFSRFPDIVWGDYDTYPPRPSAWHDQSTVDFWALGFAIHDCGFAYSLTEDTAYAAQARDMLLGFADIYHLYPQEAHGVTFDQSKIFVQRLDEAMLGVDVGFGYSCIKDFCTPTQRTHIEDDFLKPIVTCVFAFSGQGDNNYTCVCDECGAVIGHACGDADLIGKALNGHRATDGFYYVTDNWIRDDGSTKEGTMGYHLMGLRGLIGSAEAFRVAGTDLYAYNNDRLKLAMNFIVNFVFPDNVSPATHDGSNVKITDYVGTAVYHNMYFAYQDDIFLSVIKDSPRRFTSMEGRPEPARYFETLDAVDLPERTSMTFPYIGMGILRSGTGMAQQYALMDYGPFDFHGHYDKLGIITYLAGAQMGLDPGTFSYSDERHTTWSVTTVAHNTVVVDYLNQAEESGELLFFDTTYHACQVMSAAANTVYPGVDQTRTLALTPDYLLDVFDLASDTVHTYDWFYHNKGYAASGNGLAESGGLMHVNPGYINIWRKFMGVVNDVVKVSFRYIRASVDIRLLPEPNSLVIIGEGLENTATSKVPCMTVRRAADTTRFVALHSPFPTLEDTVVTGFEKMNETATALGVRVIGRHFRDYVVLATGTTAEQTLASSDDAGEFVTFTGRFCRINNPGDTVKVYGDVSAFSVYAQGAAAAVINGVPVTPVVNGAYLQYPTAGIADRTAGPEKVPGLRLSPRPCENRVSFTAADAVSVVRIFTAAGEPVATLVPSGKGAVWDGLDRFNRPALPGMYYYRATVDGREVSGRFIKIR